MRRAYSAALAAVALWAPRAASAEAASLGPDRAACFARIAPHFHEPAGSPRPGLTRGKATYGGEGFTVGRPELVMPTGAGMLSAMVAYGDRLELLLSDTGYYNAAVDNGSGAAGNHVNPLLSPGRIAIELDGATARDLRTFDQWIDFARGAVIVELETREGRVRADVAGDLAAGNLVVSIRDFRRGNRKPATVRYETWRDAVAVGGEAGELTATEAGAPGQSMSLAVQVGCVGGAGFTTACSSHQGSIVVPAAAAADFVVIVSAQCAHGRPPVSAARTSWKMTADLSAAEREAAARAWWSDFWSRSWLDLHGPGADYLERLWYTTLYSYACVGQGSMLPKFNGGPGLVFKDARSWGDAYWWQNQREISFWPMAAAGHAEFTRRAILFYNQAFAVSRDNARKAGLGGVLMREGNRPSDWSLPFGTQDPLVGPPSEPFAPGETAPDAALALRREAKPGYNALNFTPGIEFTQAIFDYVQFTGDIDLLRRIGAPWLKGETIMALGLLMREADGRYHVRCADATEQWWKVDDPAPLLAGIRCLLTLAVRHGGTLGFEPSLLAAVGERLERLAPLPTVAAWDYQTEKPGNLWFCPAAHIVPGDALLAPFQLTAGIRAHNGENPELYAVFPFGLIDLQSAPADLALARRTFAHRFFKNNAGWSQCPVQAARLGLPDTLAIILDHAAHHQKWPYGGWNSSAGLLYPGSAVVDCPFFDAAGVNLTALQESLLQSQDVIRLLPAVSGEWSGSFRLHARGGFTVTVTFERGRPKTAIFEASRDAELRVLNPFAPPPAILTRQMKAGQRVTLRN